MPGRYLIITLINIIIVTGGYQTFPWRRVVASIYGSSNFDWHMTVALAFRALGKTSLLSRNVRVP